MNFNQNVDKEFVDAILESSLWQKAKVEVVERKPLNENANEGEIGTVTEYEKKDIANQYAEPTDIEGVDSDEVEGEVTFSLDDLQLVLDNLNDDDLMEHAMSMLDVFDVAYEQLNEGEGDEDEEEEEEEEEEKEEK